MKIQSKTRVILQDGETINPMCKHGPTVLFERESAKGDKIVTRQFYACSAFRDRKDCPFFMWKDKVSKGKPTTMMKSKSIKKKLQTLSGKQFRDFCHTCCVLLDDNDLQSGEHLSHRVQSNLTPDLIAKPTRLLKPLDSSKKQAQFHFSKSTLTMLIQILADKKEFSHLICIGVPSVFEEVRGKVNAILLDIDHRHRQFRKADEFCHYNMFNHYFFNGQGKSNYQKFVALKGSKKKSFAIITDPPFGGRVEFVANTLKTISNEVDNNAHLFWIFPYYMESQISQVLPNLKMSDYQITYIKSGSYKQGHQGFRKQGSPVRLFTTFPLSKIKVPEEEKDNYRFCQTCNQYVAITNRHCHFCGCCTAKNGGLYHHCHLCRRCVKLSWQHCPECHRCALPQHPCDEFKHRGAVQDQEQSMQQQ